MAGQPVQAVILAAGRGERMRAIARSKPLLALLGMPLLERLVRTVYHCGIDDIIVVTGHEDNAIHHWLHQFNASHDARQRPCVTLVHNPHWADTENGMSLLAADPHIRGPFLLLMADHVYDTELIHSLCKAPLPANGAVLATDISLLRSDIDMDDVTRVRLDGEHVTAIDKHLPDYQGFDTGAFLCSPAVMKAMRIQSSQGRSRISDAMQQLADRRLLLAHRSDTWYWQDVDTPAALALAEQALLDQAAGKSADGPVARWLNRPLSRIITRRLASTPVTPNQVSLIAFALGLIAAALLAVPWWPSLLVGGLLVQLASIVDGCDGELARLHDRSTRYGGWLDALLDRYADAAVLAALTWHVMQTTSSAAAWWLGILAITGSFISSYSAHKTDNMLPKGALRIGRDTRSLIIMIGALLNQPLASLWVVAILMNLVVLKRILAMRQTRWSVPDRYPTPAIAIRTDTRAVARGSQAIRDQLEQSPVPEDAGHAEDTLKWLLTLKPDADEALRLAALAHDIERARPDRVQQQDFDDYDAFKAAHARLGAEITDALLEKAGLPETLRARVRHLVRNHETGGDTDSDTLQDADSLSYFSHNLPFYYQREGWAATLKRAQWGYRRLSDNARRHYASIWHDDATLMRLLASAKAPNAADHHPENPAPSAHPPLRPPAPGVPVP